MKYLPVLVILAAITVIGLNGNPAYADPGNTVITDVGPQGGVFFNVIDPDGIKSLKIVGVEDVDWVDCSGIGQEVIPDNPSCPTEFNPPGYFCPLPNNEGLATIEITDCQQDMSTSTWEIHGTDRTAVCVDNCGPPPPCNVVPMSNPSIDMLAADPNNCLIADDKIFTNFRNYNGCGPDQITVRPTFVGDEKGLLFQNNGCLFSNSNLPNVGVVFEYDVISQGTPIIDNTLTLDFFSVNDPTSSPNTRIQVSEQVQPTQQQNIIAFKEVFADGTGAQVLSDHRDFAPQQSISVNVDIGIITSTPPGAVSSASIGQFTQTFSQEPEPRQPVVGGEFLSIDSTALLMAAAQSPSALLTSLTIAALGIGAYVFSRNQNNLRNIKAILQDYLDRF